MACYEFSFVLHAGFIASAFADLYEEDYGPSNGDITGVLALKADGSIPPSQQGAHIYNFRVGAGPEQAALRRLLAEAHGLVTLAGRGVAPPGAEAEVWQLAESGAVVSVDDAGPERLEMFAEKRGLACAGRHVLLIVKVARNQVEQWTTDVDQLDLSDLVVIREIARQLLIIEYQYAEKVRGGEHGRSAGASSSVAGLASITNDERDLIGRQPVNPTVCWALMLIGHVGEELQKKSQSQKH
ncbi:unnamed protein product, partial [Prorocentrum cordatum]